MYLKQELKQKINVSLSTRRDSAFNFPVSARALDQTLTRFQRIRRRLRLGTNYEWRDEMLHTVDGAADYLSVSRSTVYRLIEVGKLKRVYVMGVPRITQASLLHVAGERNG